MKKEEEGVEIEKGKGKKKRAKGVAGRDRRKDKEGKRGLGSMEEKV